MRTWLEPLDVDRHAPLLHAWVTHPRSVFWMMQGASVDDVRREYADIVASPHHDAWLGRVGPEDRAHPAFLAETYDPAHSPLVGHHDTQPGDLGMHVLVAPTETPVHGFTAAVFAAVMRHCFTLPGHGGDGTRRVVVEPDARNTAIHDLNARAGFVAEREVDLPDKRALLSACTREQFEASELGASFDPTGDAA
ncbi:MULTISPECIES: GNAT family N-acetyltransferase [unclassified Aeromicrobium]|uniref:GNAT family N-acetyltransferase n=1 Tax=unclassified Aeromicrobium TaxID=2633570 RepID=UPI00288A00CC|nr:MULTISPECIES: GNAT family N-acetyltransferase [unclassified Aeromicrobium]